MKQLRYLESQHMILMARQDEIEEQRGSDLKRNQRAMGDLRKEISVYFGSNFMDPF
jgi:hypothetical protein